MSTWSGWFAGLRVVVTGAGGGIGQALVDTYTAGGATVAAIDIPGRWDGREPAPERVRRFEAILGAEPGTSDVIAECLAWRGGADVLVNNAGTTVRAPLADSDAALIDHVLEANLKSALLTTRAALDALRVSRGNVVNVASINALKGNRDLSAYAASKGGMAAMTRALAVELAVDGIRVNCVCPGTVATEMTDEYLATVDDPDDVLGHMVAKHPLGRIAEAHEVASVIAFLSSPSAAFVTGVTIPVDGGRSIF